MGARGRLLVQMDAPCLAKGTSAERKRGRGVKDTKEEDEEEEEEEEEEW